MSMSDAELNIPEPFTLHLHFKQPELSTTDQRSHKVIYVTENNSYRSMEMNI